MPLPPVGSLSRSHGVQSLGVGLGHWTDHRTLTGVTVLLPPPGTTAGVDVRGGGPATHETEILAPGTLDYGADAIVLTGGSAFGLAAAGGVQEHLKARGIGCEAGDGIRVPIVPAAAIFDLGRCAGAPTPPDRDAGAAAARSAAASLRTNAGSHETSVPTSDAASHDPRGSVGAGTGAWTGRGISRGGMGQASITTAAGHTVTAVVIANPLGSLLAADGQLHAASTLASYGMTLPRVDPHHAVALREGRSLFGSATDAHPAPREQTADSTCHAASHPLNTTIACIVTDARLTDAQTTRLAASAHAGISRAVNPSHTIFDGDAVFALSTGAVPLDPREQSVQRALLGVAVADALTAAIVDAILLAGDYVDELGHPTPPPRPESPPPLGAVFPQMTQAWLSLD